MRSGQRYALCFMVHDSVGGRESINWQGCLRPAQYKTTQNTSTVLADPIGGQSVVPNLQQLWFKEIPPDCIVQLFKAASLYGAANQS